MALWTDRNARRQLRARTMSTPTCHDLPVRIATWNLEQAQPSSPAWRLLAGVMTEVAADIWIVTEAPA
jgi:hypothetical protein